MTKARILADYVAGGTTAAEFDYMDGVTSNVQTQLDAKAPTASPTFTGNFTSVGIDDNADATAITIDSSEKVGIGTAPPAKQLEVSAAIPTIRLNSTEGNVGNTDILGEISWKSADANRTGDPITYIRTVSANATGSASDLTFGTYYEAHNATERMRINYDGKVGINTTTMNEHFNVHNNIWTSEGIYINTHNGDYQIRVGQTGGGSATLAIGNRSITVYDASDERKKDVIGETSRGLAEVLKWVIKDFTWKPEWDRDSTTIKTGAIAQELIEVSPELVNKHEVYYSDNDLEQDDIPEGKKVGDLKSDVWGIEWINAIPYLVKAIQELSAKNDALEAENTALKTRMDALEARVTALEPADE